MTITALHLIQAVELLNEVASGEAEPDIRRQLMSLGASLRMAPALTAVGVYMEMYAHGTVTDHGAAMAHVGTIKTIAAGFVLPPTVRYG